MRVGWLVDAASYEGGAEHTQAELRAAAPDGIEIVDCPAGEPVEDCDVYAIHNCVKYTLQDLETIGNRPTVKYWNDIGSWLLPGVHRWLDRHATTICCSPLQAEYMGYNTFPDEGVALIPPPIDLAPFRDAATHVNGDRGGNVSVGSWRNLGKAPHRVAAWAAGNGGVDFYGEGPFAPNTSRPVAYGDMPQLLARYRTFVFLPQVIEPFGRSVAEAWAAGCELIINDLVGAKYWITENPGALETAAEDFWKVVLS